MTTRETTDAAGADGAHGSALTHWERGAHALSALLVLSSLIVLPAVRAVDPVLAVAINFAGDSASSADRSAAIMLSHGSPRSVEIERSSDPWGRPWRVHLGAPYSVGPDGLDAECAGDDVTRSDTHEHPLRAWTPKEVLGSPRLTLLAAGLALAVWTLITRKALRASRAGPVVEARRAALVAAVPATAGFLWILAGVPRLEERFAESGAGGVVQLPASVAIPLTWALVCYLPALAWRLSRPQSDAPLT